MGSKNPEADGNKPESAIRAANRSAILNAATVLFAEKGFEGTRVADIAERAQLPKANVYYYFASKDELYAEILVGVSKGWEGALKLFAEEADPEQAFMAYIDAKLAFSREHSLQSRLFANEVIHGAKRLSVEHRRRIKQLTDTTVLVIEAWMRAGKLQSMDARALLFGLWGMTQFYADYAPVVELVLGPDSKKRSRFEHAARDTLAAMVLRGVLPQ